MTGSGRFFLLLLNKVAMAFQAWGRWGEGGWGVGAWSGAGGGLGLGLGAEVGAGVLFFAHNETPTISIYPGLGGLGFRV